MDGVENSRKKFPWLFEMMSPESVPRKVPVPPVGAVWVRFRSNPVLNPGARAPRPLVVVVMVPKLVFVGVLRLVFTPANVNVAVLPPDPIVIEVVGAPAKSPAVEK